MLGVWGLVIGFFFFFVVVRGKVSIVRLFFERIFYVLRYWLCWLKVFVFLVVGRFFGILFLVFLGRIFFIRDRVVRCLELYKFGFKRFYFELVV